MTLYGITFLGIGTYCGFLYASYKREVGYSRTLTVPEDVSDRYNQTAGTFDADVAMSELLMRMGSKRRDLIQHARGDVLEVSCGTGRNVDYYDFNERRGVDQAGHAEVQGCRSVKFVDLSAQMVEITKEKFQKKFPGFTRVGFEIGHAGEVKPPAAAATGKPYYDTVVQTMGLCSMPDPVKTLRHLGEITEPKKGRILLLEHGRSKYGWLNDVLDNLASAHADRHGCWWNKDIGEIVRESGLEIVEEERWHFGTTWRYVLKPRG